MKISIITPTYNSGKYIRETIDSIHNQGFKNVEHIVVDGLSTDNTEEIVKSFKQIHWISEKDNGQSDAINKGFKLATGDIFAWQNADDLYLPMAFETIVNFFERNPNIDVVYGYYQLINQRGEWLCDVFPIQWNKWLFAHGRFVPLQPTVFWRRKVFEVVGLLDEKLHFCMDVDYFSRIANNGFKFALIKEMIGQFRVHDESKTQNSLNKIQVYNEYKKVLASNFNYNFIDRVFFDAFQIRSRLARAVKLKFLKKY